jgi:hypothetical protein
MFLPNGQYAGLVLIYNLTNAAGVTMTRDNLGTIALQWNGKDVISTIDVDFLNRIGDVYGGVSAFSSAIGAAAYAFVYIPFSEWFDPSNIYDIQPNDNVSIRCFFPDLSNIAICASGNVTIYAIDKVGTMNYLHKMTTRNVAFSAAGTQTDSFAYANIAQVYLKDAVANLLTRFILRKNGQTVVDGVVADLVAYSDWIHTLETTNAIIAIELAPSKNVAEAIGGEIEYTMEVSGLATVEQYFSYIQYTPEKSEVSRLVAANTLNNRMSRV